VSRGGCGTRRARRGGAWARRRRGAWARRRRGRGGLGTRRGAERLLGARRALSGGADALHPALDAPHGPLAGGWWSGRGQARARIGTLGPVGPVARPRAGAR